MIFPILNGIYSFFKAPVTWLLFVVNFAVFVVTYEPAIKLQTRLEKSLEDRTFTRIQGGYFARFIDAHQERYPASLQYLAQRSLSGDAERQRLLGGMAMRDTQFLAQAMKEEFSGDQVALKWWREKFNDIEETKEIHPSYNLGLTDTNSSFIRWLTYQFAHSGWSHFIGNMIFLLLFGTHLELIIGSVGVLTVYLLSGIFAALVFLFLNDSTAVPLVGASGAISGLMALFCVLFWQRGVRYIFFLLIPRRGFAGIVYLPAWLILILWGLSDLAGHWATPSEMGGVAYSAHLGGELCGILFGLTYFLVRRLQGKSFLPENLPLETKPIFTHYI